MVKVKTIDNFDLKEIVEKIVNGALIIRVNVEQCSVINLGSKAINRIAEDEKNHPNAYVYVEVVSEQKNES